MEQFNAILSDESLLLEVSQLNESKINELKNLIVKFNFRIDEEFCGEFQLLKWTIKTVSFNKLTSFIMLPPYLNNRKNIQTMYKVIKKHIFLPDPKENVIILNDIFSDFNIILEQLKELMLNTIDQNSMLNAKDLLSSLYYSSLNNAEITQKNIDLWYKVNDPIVSPWDFALFLTNIIDWCFFFGFINILKDKKLKKEVKKDIVKINQFIINQDFRLYEELSDEIINSRLGSSVINEVLNKEVI